MCVGVAKQLDHTTYKMAVSINVFATITQLLLIIYLLIAVCIPAGYALEPQAFPKQFNWKAGGGKTEVGNGIQRLFGVNRWLYEPTSTVILLCS